MHYREFAFEYKMHKVGSPLSLYLENTRQEQEINKIHKWYGRQWELTQTLAREKANKNKSQCKDDQQILPHIRLPIVKDKKYLERIPGGR